ncbi:MAG: hypothetical protein RLZZ455_157 [Candidatus Parcubacteria bacterium]|jgi:hypothetical protein
MDQNQNPPAAHTDTPAPSTPPTPPVTETPATPQSVTPPVSETPAPITPPAPVVPQTPETPATPVPPAAPAAPTAPASTDHDTAHQASENHQTPPSIPPSSHKKTIAVAAAGVSVILVVLGVYAMSKDNFNTQTKQEAAMQYTAPTQAAPTLSPTPSDVVDQDLSSVEAALKNADAETAVAEQELSATPVELQ